MKRFLMMMKALEAWYPNVKGIRLYIKSKIKRETLGYK